jgi:hypothetical protein
MIKALLQKLWLGRSWLLTDTFNVYIDTPFDSQAPVKCPEYQVLGGSYGREEGLSRLNPAEPVGVWRVMSPTSYQAELFIRGLLCKQLADRFQFPPRFRGCLGIRHLSVLMTMWETNSLHLYCQSSGRSRFLRGNC